MSFVCGWVGGVGGGRVGDGGGGRGLVTSLCVLVIQYVLLDRTWPLNVLPLRSRVHCPLRILVLPK